MIHLLIFCLFGLLQAMQLSPYSRMNALISRHPSRTRCLSPKCYALPPKIKYDWVMENDQPTSTFTNELPPPTIIKKKHDHPLCTVPKFVVMGTCAVVQLFTFLPCMLYYSGVANPLTFVFAQLFLAASTINDELVEPVKTIKNYSDVTFYLCPPGNEYESLEVLEEKCFTKIPPYTTTFYDTEAKNRVLANDIDNQFRDPKDWVKTMAFQYKRFVLVPVDLKKQEIYPTSPVFSVKKRGERIVFCK